MARQYFHYLGHGAVHWHRDCPHVIERDRSETPKHDIPTWRPGAQQVECGCDVRMEPEGIRECLKCFALGDDSAA